LAFWSNIWSALGALWRGPGIQISEPSTGRLTDRQVTPDTALQISSVFACIRLLSETIAGLPLNFYTVKDGVKELVTDHPLADLLSTRPNRYQTRVEFLETAVMQMALHGNFYAKIDRSGKRVISLLPLMSLQVQTALDERGNILHKYYDGRKIMEFPAEQVWHTKLFGNGIVGLSPLQFARNSIGIAIGAEDRVNKLSNTGFKQHGVLSMDKILTPEQRKQLKAAFADITDTDSDALRVLEAGMKFTPTSMNPKDVQLLESRRFQTEDICRFFGVPSVLVNDTSATTAWGSGIEQIINGFYKLGLRPYLERFEASISSWLLATEERRVIFPEFDFDMLLRGDEKTRFETHKTAIQGGVKTPNECRRAEGLKALPGGDKLLVQQQMVPLDTVKGGKNEKVKSTVD
jgi:HK97 family phage portal protein